MTRGPGNRALDQGTGHPRPDGQAEEEPIVELSATTTTPPAGMRGPASPAVLLPGPLEPVAAILRWYESHARDLPWRRATASPWAVLVSEIMLQQTPVARVLPAYEAWLARWPTPPALAAAAPADAVRQWGRLGYPRRALRLHAAAQVISERHGREVPSSVDALLALPGVGSYTAAPEAASVPARSRPPWCCWWAIAGPRPSARAPCARWYRGPGAAGRTRSSPPPRPCMSRPPAARSGHRPSWGPPRRAAR